MFSNGKLWYDDYYIPTPDRPMVCFFTLSGRALFDNIVVHELLPLE